MSGSRCKALRKAFVAFHGRAPSLSRVSQTFGQVPFGKRAAAVLKSTETFTSEWRRLKRAYLARRTQGAIHGTK